LKQKILIFVWLCKLDAHVFVISYLQVEKIANKYKALSS